MSNNNDPRYEVIPVYGTKDEIGAIIQGLEDVEIVDWGTDMHQDFTVELRVPTARLEEILSHTNQGSEKNELGALANGITTSFKESEGGVSKERG